MKRTSIFLPPDLIARLDAEAARTGIKVSALIRRCCDAMVPPVGVSAGELRKHIDRYGQVRVLVLDARDGRLLVEPEDTDVQIWVDANLVRFDQSVIPRAPVGESAGQSLRLNKDAPTSEPEEP